MQSNATIFQQQQQQQLLQAAYAAAAGAGSGVVGGSGGGGPNSSIQPIGKYSVFTEITQQMQQQQQQQQQQQNLQQHQQHRRHTMGCPPQRHPQQLAAQDAENIPPAGAGQDRPNKRGRYEHQGSVLQNQQQQQILQQHLPMPPPGWAAAAAQALRLQMPPPQQQQQQLSHALGTAPAPGAYNIVPAAGLYPMLQLIQPMQQQQQQQQQHQKQQPQTKTQANAIVSSASDSPLDLSVPKASTNRLAKPNGPPLTLSASICGGPVPLDLSFNAGRPAGVHRTERSRKQRRSLPPSMLSAQQQQQQRQPVPMLSPLLFPSPTSATAPPAAAPASASSTAGHHQLADHLPRLDASPEPPSGGGSDSQHSAPGAGDDPNACRGGRQPVTTCHQCGRGFVCQGDMNAHFESEHLAALMGEFDHGKSWKSSAVENKELNVEATMVRLENGDTIGFKCPECDYFAKWPTELQKHIMVHSSARPHVCVVCGCTYKWKWDLGRHFDRSHESAAMPNPYKKNSARPSSGGSYPSGASTARSTPRAPRQSGGGGASGSSSSRLASPLAGGGGVGGSTTTELLAYYSTPARSAAMAAAAAAAVAAAAAGTSEGAASPTIKVASTPPPPLLLKSENEDVADEDSQATNQLSEQLACPICGAQARWPAELKAHVVGHSDFRPYRCSGCPFISRDREEVVAHLDACDSASHPADCTVLCEPPPHLAGVFADEAEVADYAERATTRRRLEFDDAATPEVAANEISRPESEAEPEVKENLLLKSQPASPEAPSSSARYPPEMPRADSPSDGAGAVAHGKQQQQQVAVPQSPCRLECGASSGGSSGSRGGAGSSGVEQRLLQLP